MSQKQYKFSARSSMSFAVAHRGQQQYVTFSPTYRGLSMYITTDEGLAAKIRAHRWFREGRITEQVIEIQKAPEVKPFVPKMLEPKPKYSILGRPMATAIRPASPQPPKEKEPQQAAGNPQQEAEALAAFVVEDVTSFMEAKEFFITNFGVQRSEVATKEAISELCKKEGIVFPNYSL